MCRCGGAGDHEHGIAKEIIQIHSLFDHVDFEKSHCLNIRKSGDLRQVFREKFEDSSVKEAFLESDADQQIIIKIQYASCNLNNLIIV